MVSKMGRIYYSLQYRSQLDLLRSKLKESRYQGFYLPLRLFTNLNTRSKFIESLALLGRDVIITNNYWSKLRPSLLADEIICPPGSTNKHQIKDLKIKKDKMDYLKLLQDNSSLLHYVQEEYSKYAAMKEFILNKGEEKKKDPIDDLLFEESLNSSRQSIYFEFPFIPLGPFNLKPKNNKYEVDALNKLIDKINGQLFTIQTSKKEYQNCIHTIPISLNLFEDQTAKVNDLIQKGMNFNRICLWIIDFNEHYATKKDINLLQSILVNFEEKEEIILKYPGKFGNQFLTKLGPNYAEILRLNGFPGQNINLTFKKGSTRRFLDPQTGQFFSLNSIGEVLKSEIPKPMDCSCLICKNNNIRTYNKAKLVYLSNEPQDEDFFKYFIGKAIKTAPSKARKKQNELLLQHCFHNTDRIMNLEYNTFKSQFNSGNNCNEWFKIIDEVNLYD